MPEYTTTPRQETTVLTTIPSYLEGIGTPLRQIHPTTIFYLPFVSNPLILLQISTFLLNYQDLNSSKSYRQSSAFRA